MYCLLVVCVCARSHRYNVMKVLSDILPTGFQLPSKHSALSPKHELHRTRYLQLPLTDSLLTKTTLAAHDAPCHGWSLSPRASCNRARLGHLIISRSHVGLHVMSSSARDMRSSVADAGVTVAHSTAAPVHVEDCQPHSDRWRQLCQPHSQI